MAEDPALTVAKTLAKVAANIKDANRAAITDAAQVAKQTMLDEAASFTHGGVLRNVGRRGARLSAGYEIVVFGAGATATISARGPWGIVQSGNRAYEIRPRRRGGKRALSFDGKAFAVVHRSAKSGRGSNGPWEKGRDKAVPKANRVLQDRYIRAAARAF